MTIAPVNPCAGDETYFEAAFVPLATYAWDFGPDATPSTATGWGVEDVIWNTSGSKNVTLTVTKNDCESTSTIVINVTNCGAAFRFIDINAAAMEDAVMLEWDVEDEAPLSNYLIEHSKDGKEFFAIDLMPVTNPNLETNHYQYMHYDAKIGNNFYRVKYVGYNGNTETSEMVRAMRVDSESGSLMIYPNPVEDQMTIEFLNDTHEKGLITIVDALGREKKQINVSPEDMFIQVDFSEYVEGMYFICLLYTSPSPRDRTRSRMPSSA